MFANKKKSMNQVKANKKSNTKSNTNIKKILPKVSIQAPKTDKDEQTDPIMENINSLTPRERELFYLLLKGYTLKKSAEQLSVKYSTVNTHMTNIYKKLNVNTRAELIIKYHKISE